MNSVHALTAENLLRALPEVLRNDESMAALAASVAQVLAQRPEEILRLAIYPRIDELPEELLDILAYDFKVDWWDADYTLEEKRRTLKNSWRVHRMLGTKAAVELAISAIYPDAHVSEWFEYGGDPYHFKLQIDVSHETVGSERYRRVLDRVNFYKNLRSHLDSIIYVVNAEGVATGYAGAALCGGYMRISVPVDINGDVRPPHIQMEAPSGACTGGTYMRVTAPVKVDEEVKPPHLLLPAPAGAQMSGAYTKTQAAVAVDGVERPHSRPPVYAGSAAAETYFKITTEVSSHELEQINGN